MVGSTGAEVTFMSGGPFKGNPYICLLERFNLSHFIGMLIFLTKGVISGKLDLLSE